MKERVDSKEFSHLIKGKFPFNVSQRDVKVAYLVNFSPVTYPTYTKHVHTVYNTYFHQSVKCVLFCVVNNEKKKKLNKRKLPTRENTTIPNKREDSSK